MRLMRPDSFGGRAESILARTSEHKIYGLRSIGFGHPELLPIGLGYGGTY
jgi:hypothetical protein